MNLQRHIVAAAALAIAGGLSCGAAHAITVPTPLTVGGSSSEFDFNGGHPNTYFSFTVPSGQTDVFNIGAAYDPTDTGEELSVANSINGGTFSTPVDYTIGSGISLDYATGSWVVDVALVTENDPKNNFSLTAISATPLPATLPLFAAGLGFVGYLTKRRKQNAKKAIAAA